MMQRARLAQRRHPELGEVSAYCFYATRLGGRHLAFDVGANHGEHTGHMIRRGATVVAIEPQADLAAELAERFPAATVLPVAVSDEPGRAFLHLASGSDAVASLDPGFMRAAHESEWEERQEVPVTTLDRLIDEYGQPTLLKIDTEGTDYRVLRGLSRPIDHILFEVHSSLPDHAAQAFARLDELGPYDYSVSEGDRWLFTRGRPDEILSALPEWGDVYARSVP